MFIDIHVHLKRFPIPRPSGEPVEATPEQVLETYDRVGIERGVVQPVVSPEAFILPQSNEEILEICRQNGRNPATSKKPGRKILTSAINALSSPPNSPENTKPKYAEKENIGPGIACDAP